MTIALGRADRRSRSARADPAWAQIQGGGENHCRIPKAGFPAVQVVGSSPPQQHHSDRFHPADLSAAYAKSLDHAPWQLFGLMNGSVFLQPLPFSCAKYRAPWPNPAATKRTKRDRYSLSASICRKADAPMRRVPRQAFVDPKPVGLGGPCPLEKPSFGAVAHAFATRAGISQVGGCATAPEMFAKKTTDWSLFAAGRCLIPRGGYETAPPAGGPVPACGRDSHRRQDKRRSADGCSFRFAGEDVVAFRPDVGLEHQFKYHSDLGVRLKQE